MKRILVAVSALLAVSALAVLPSRRTPLSNFDVRAPQAAGSEEVAPEHTPAVQALQARVPQLKVTRSQVLNTPSFFSSSTSFLTGPDAQGLGVLPVTAQGIPANDPHRAVKAFMTEHAGLIGYGPGVLDGARISRDYVGAHNGMRTVIWQQELNNIPVFDAITMGHITSQGELVNLYTHFVPDATAAAVRGLKGRSTAAGAAASARLSAAEAIVIATRNIGDEIAVNSLNSLGAAQGPGRKQSFRGSGALHGDQHGELVWLPLNSGTLRLYWQVIISSRTRSEMFLCLVDAETGEVVVRRCLTNYVTNSTYNVWTSDSPSPFSPGYTVPGNPAQPAVVARSLITLPALNTNASPLGWINDTVNETRGNNVDAHTDHNDDDQADTPRPTGNPFHVFDFPIDLAQSPTNYSTGAVVQLFYWNNFIHDKLWELGFTEAAGNFQATNFGRGGLGNDAVEADAQDGALLNDGFHVNNANMATPPDGFPARMQMYLFDGPTPDRDGDLDAEVMLHEYTHGLSNRRVGGGLLISAFQTAGMGEGWSDFYGLSLLSEAADPINGQWAMGGYVTYDISPPQFRDNYYFGIRRYPYTTNLLKNPLTFKDIDTTQALPHTGIPRNPIFGPFSPFDANEVHNQGEVWCVTLFELRANLIAKYGFAGNQLALQLVTDAMALCPPNPNFLQSRDAILQADVVNNANANYAEIWRAFAKRGMGSSATSPNSSTTLGVRESFDFPGLAVVSVGSSDGSTGNGNGTIDVNECVEIFVTLRNNSVVTARSILATLQTTTPGVVVTAGASAYPNIPASTSAQNLTAFRIYTTPSFVCGTPIQFSLIASSVTTTQQVTTNVFSLRTGLVSLSPTLANNSTPVNIPDANTNGVESVINISGQGDAVGKVVVSLYLTHTSDSDLAIQLISPDGTIVNLSKNEGGLGQNFGSSCSPFSARTTFDDNAPLPISVGTAPFVGSFRPTETLAAFAGKSGAALNGAWRLRIIDSGPLDVGTLQCWTLALYPTLCADGGGSCLGDVAVRAAVTPAPALLGQNLTYTVSVTNHRPISASGVILTNVLPPTVAFVSATTAQGNCTFTNGTVRCNFGTLLNGSNATATIVVQPLSLGLLTNVFTVGSSSADSVPSNNLATVVSSVMEPVPQFVASGAELGAESFVPANGGIEAGETVTVSFALRNIGSGPSANLMATLVEANGVTGASAPQNYGAIPVGLTAFRNFTFTAAGNAGDAVTATLALQDGAQNLGTVSFHFTLGGEVTFENTAPIVINAVGPASPYPATINVSGLTGVISQVRVTFVKLSHTFPDDIDALLVGPGGQKLVLMSDCGGNNVIVNRTLTFASAAAAKLPNETLISAGSYLPSDYVSGTELGGDVFPAPAPGGALSSSLTVFNSTLPNGAWSLFINDDGGGDGGTVSGGWSLTISTVVPVNPVANLAITAVASPNPAIVGESLIYTLTVANQGPSNAPSVVVSDTIPSGSTFVSASGGATFAAGVVTANLGTINSGTNASLTITVTPTITGLLVNTAVVSSAAIDLNLENNIVTTTVVANNPVADLAVSVSATPEPVFVTSNAVILITVTNRGPNHADSVQVVNQFNLLFNLIGITNSQGGYTVDGTLITINFGSIPAHGTATAAFFVNAAGAGSAVNLFTVVSPTTDPVASNNTATVTSTIQPLQPILVTSGVALQGEGFAPANGAIESGEPVTVSFGLRNTGTANTASLVATLLSSGGVLNPSAAQNYGAVVVNGPTVARSFSFTANAAPGATVTATLQLQDGASDLGTVSFNFTLSASRGFTNGTIILIPDHGQATNYPSTLTVSGVTGTVSKVTVTIKQLTHTFPEDIDMLLVGPAGQKVILMSDAGAGNAITGRTLTFDDSAAALPFTGTITSGSYHAMDYPPGDSFPAPAPAGPYGTNLSAFNAVNPNGTWSLYVFDDAAGDAGRIDGGWTLDIQTAAPIVSSADVAVTATAPATGDSGATLTYTITAANYGPAIATSVVVSDILPDTFVLNGATTSQGSYTTGPGFVTANLGALGVGATATITISGAGVGPRSLANVATIASALTDLNPGNNSITLVTELSAPALTILHSGTNSVITWRSPSTGYVLEVAPAVTGPWVQSGAPVIVAKGLNTVTVPVNGVAFYRLRKP